MQWFIGIRRTICANLIVRGWKLWPKVLHWFEKCYSTNWLTHDCSRGLFHPVEFRLTVLDHLINIANVRRSIMAWLLSLRSFGGYMEHAWKSLIFLGSIIFESLNKKVRKFRQIALIISKWWQFARLSDTQQRWTRIAIFQTIWAYMGQRRNEPVCKRLTHQARN